MYKVLIVVTAPARDANTTLTYSKWHSVPHRITLWPPHNTIELYGEIYDVREVGLEGEPLVGVTLVSEKDLSEFLAAAQAKGDNWVPKFEKAIDWRSLVPPSLLPA